MDASFLPAIGFAAPLQFAVTEAPTGDLVNLVAAAFLIALCGFFVAAEYALVKARPTRLEELATSGSWGAKLALASSRRLNRYLSTTQVGVTISTLLLGKIGEPAMANLLTPLFTKLRVGDTGGHAIAFIVSLGVMGGLAVVFGEQVPKILSIQRAERVAIFVAPFMTLFYKVMFVPVLLLSAATNVSLRLIGIDPSKPSEAHSPEEIYLIVTSSEERGAVGTDEAEMARNAIIIGDRNARDVMVPRVDMAFLTTALSLAENIERANVEGYTRFPLCDPDADHVIGMVHIKDLLSVAGSAEATILDTKRDILVVPETKALDNLLREFQASHIHMALVLDEYGGTAGIVTLEDVLEEIVGDIQDEHQHEHPEVQSVGDNSWLVDGAVTLDDLDRDLGIPLEAEDADTIAGFVQWKLGAVPEAGQSISTDGYSLKVEAMEGRRVRTVLITRRRGEPEPD